MPRYHYTAIATDIINGKEVIFEDGSLYDAIRASISIPTTLYPFEANTLVSDNPTKPRPTIPIFIFLFIFLF